jgi:hypothetical protein
MADVSRVLLPFVLVGLALLLEQARADPADNSSTIEQAAAATPTAPARQDGNVIKSSPDAEQKNPAKSPSIIKMLEGRENDVVLWVSIATVSFIIGWICGGNYYLRRDRTRRRKLRF